MIENTQRDLNIALMNELTLIFGKLGISTATGWMSMTPGSTAMRPSTNKGFTA